VYRVGVDVQIASVQGLQAVSPFTLCLLLLVTVLPLLVCTCV
jgi:hypothetical protein